MLIYNFWINYNGFETFVYFYYLTNLKTVKSIFWKVLPAGGWLGKHKRVIFVTFLFKFCLKKDFNRFRTGVHEECGTLKYQLSSHQHQQTVQYRLNCHPTNINRLYNTG